MGVRAVGILALVVAVGCTDKAKPDYSACVAAEAKEDVLTASIACERAITMDPTSESGIAATAKLKAMQPAIEQARRERAEKEARAAEEQRKAEEAAERAAAKAKAERIAKLRVKVKSKYWSFKPDPTCLGKGKPQFMMIYEGGTFAENDEVALAAGCVKEPMLDTTYCCPTGPSDLGLQIRALQESGLFPDQ